MRLFSRKKRSKSSMGSLKRSGKRLLIMSGCMLSLFMMAPVANNSILNTMTGTIEAQAAQSTRWVGSGDRWQVSDNQGGFLKNCWFEDLDGNWYMLGAEDGSVMYAGLVTDNSTNKTYLLNTNHDGTYGRMLTVNGTYNVNGVNVYLEFNQNHDGTFGAITSGLSEARATGVTESKRDNIPTEDGGGVTGSTGNKKGVGGGLSGGTGGYTIPEKEVYVP